MIWFKPPFTVNQSHFVHKTNRIHKSFNKISFKIVNSTTLGMKKIIILHNTNNKKRPLQTQQEIIALNIRVTCVYFSDISWMMISHFRLRHHYIHKDTHQLLHLIMTGKSFKAGL